MSDFDGTAPITPEEKLARAEKLRAMCGVGFADAREALEACGYDLLDAAVWLERAGRCEARSTSYRTVGSEEARESQAMSDAQVAYEHDTRKVRFEEMWQRFLDGVRHVLRKGVDTTFVVRRHDRQVLSIPVLLLVVLAVFAFWVVIPLLVVGLFFGFSYRFDGVGAVTVDVNEWSQKASEGAERIKRDFQDGQKDARE